MHVVKLHDMMACCVSDKSDIFRKLHAMRLKGSSQGILNYKVHIL